MKYTLCLISLLTLLFVPSFSAFATEYQFMGTEDSFYDNPENWIPTYPGTKIDFEDEVLIQADVYFKGFNLIIEGNFEVGLGVSITSPTNSILIKQLGTVDNYGSIEIYSVINYGKYINNVSSNLALKNFVTKNSGITNNFQAANIRIERDVINDGVFNNYSYCEVGKNLKNTRIFNQLKTSELEVAGTMLDFPGSAINHSEESVARINLVIEKSSGSRQSPPAGGASQKR